jgi:hypothetical protein
MNTVVNRIPQEKLPSFKVGDLFEDPEDDGMIYILCNPKDGFWVAISLVNGSTWEDLKNPELPSDAVENLTYIGNASIEITKQ